MRTKCKDGNDANIRIKVFLIVHLRSERVDLLKYSIPSPPAEKFDEILRTGQIVRKPKTESN